MPALIFWAIRRRASSNFKGNVKSTKSNIPYPIVTRFCLGFFNLMTSFKPHSHGLNIFVKFGSAIPTKREKGGFYLKAFLWFPNIKFGVGETPQKSRGNIFG